MDDQTFQSKFNELINKINELPVAQRAHLEQLANETKDRRERIQASVTELQESLDYLRLSVKYLVFDLEATRRENTYLRKLLEQSNADTSDQGDYDEDAGHFGESD
ncbi:MAG: transcriptional regulator [Planctomycetota bacterium]